LNLDTTPPVDHRDLIAAANRGRSTAPGFYPPAASKSPTTVEEVLKLNREREHQAGLDVLKPMPRVINRRRRDYWIVLIGGNLFFYFGLNAISGPAVGGLMAFFYTIGITWVMYGVMDKY
jgi:predicted phage tail protein